MIDLHLDRRFDCHYSKKKIHKNIFQFIRKIKTAEEHTTFFINKTYIVVGIITISLASSSEKSSTATATTTKSTTTTEA